jgi:hypothetical protein
MNNTWLSILWVLAASLLGFAISALFSGWLKLRRRVFLIPYILLSCLFLIWFFQATEIDLLDRLAQDWVWGVIAGVIVGAFLVRNVRTQPASRQSKGGDLALDLAWLGLAYGLIDALFLNVMPVIAIQDGFSDLEWVGSWSGEIGVALLALSASLWVALTYHVGYLEFRNRRVGLVLVGNGLITLAYIVSGNPVGAMLSHTVMHVAATIRGPETTLQLPPHSRFAEEGVG